MVIFNNRIDSMLPVRLFSNRSQMTSKCGKKKKKEVAHWPQAIVSLMFSTVQEGSLDASENSFSP